MATDKNDQLLERIIDELGEIRKVLGERLPQPVKFEVAPQSVDGGTRAVVTGEGSPPPPVAKPPVKKTTAPKLGR